MKNRTTRNLIIFTLMVFLSGWIGHFVDQSIPPQPGEETPGMGLWLILPLVTTLLLRGLAGDGWKDIGLKPLFGANGKWYLISLAIFPMVTAVVLLVGKLFGWIDFSGFRTGDYFSVFAVSLLPNFIKNIFEEFVWRGYLTAKLLQLKVREGWLYLLVGGIWGAWHIPYYLFFLPGSAITQILPVDRSIFALLAIVTMICWTVMYVELYRITGSIWPVVVLHMTEDSVINHLVIDHHISILPGKEIWVSPITGILPTILYLFIGFVLRKIRKEKSGNSNMPSASVSKLKNELQVY